MKYRIESDFLGELKIPSEAYYGIHTQRAIDNFPIAEVAISVYPNIVIAMPWLNWPVLVPIIN